MFFEPAIYEHAAKVIGRSPYEVSRSEELVFQAHKTARETYHHTPIVVGIDIYSLEAEAYGAKISSPEGNAIPSIVGTLCLETADVISLPSYNPRKDGRIPLFLRAAKRLKEALPEAVVKIPVSGPFSLASHLTGLETLLCDCLTDPAIVKVALKKIIDDQRRFCEAAKEYGIGVTFFESAASPPLVPPPLFRSLILPALKDLIASAADIFGETIPCIIGGNTALIIEDILQTGTKYVICPYETDQTLFMAIMQEYPDVMVRVNMNPSVFCSADIEPAFCEAERVKKLTLGRKKVCIGSGVVPYEAVTETILSVKRAFG